MNRVIDLSHGSDATYSLPASCSNCGWAGKVRVAKGDRAPGVGMVASAVTCPTCGCRAVRAQPVSRPNWLAA